MSFCTDYSQLLFIFAVLGITTVLPYFSPIMCVNNILFTESETTNVSKCINALRGIVSSILGVVCASYFFLAGCNYLGMQLVILTYSVCALLFGLLLAVAFPDFNQNTRSVKLINYFRLKQVLNIVKKPLFFRWCLIIATSYSIYILLGFYIPFIHMQYKITIENSILLGIIRYICSAVSILLAVLLETHAVSKKRILFIGYLISGIGMLCLLFLPRTYVLFPLPIFFFLLTAIWVYICREFYYSLYNASEFSEGQYGIVIGLIAFVSYIPEIFLQPFIGYFIDRNGFNIILVTGIIICIIGSMISCDFKKIGQR